MNFFFDEDNDKKESSPVAVTAPVVTSSPKKSNLIDIGDEVSIDVPKHP